MKEETIGTKFFIELNGFYIPVLKKSGKVFIIDPDDGGPSVTNSVEVLMDRLFVDSFSYISSDNMCQKVFKGENGPVWSPCNEEEEKELRSLKV